MSGHFYKVGFFNWNAKGNKKVKKGKRGKKGGFLALFVPFAFFVTAFPSLWRQILNMCVLTSGFCAKKVVSPRQSIVAPDASALRSNFAHQLEVQSFPANRP